nr:reverse transcriptase domain-containing protein [Tanacetum cinerariifolium]
MSMMKEMTFFLGLQVNQSPRSIFINQSKHVLEILKKYGIESCDPVDLDQNGTPVDATKYRSIIGALMHLTSSRPDIVHATCLCAPYQDKPTEKHLKEVKRIFHYLRGTVNMGLWYTKDFGFELTEFSDADYARCKDTFKSTSGGAQFLCEKLLTDYGFHFNKIPIYYDSKSSIAISCNPVQHSRTKYIAVRYHFIKEHMEKFLGHVINGDGIHVDPSKIEAVKNWKTPRLHDMYGYHKNHKKRAKTGQKRTRERKEYTRAGNSYFPNNSSVTISRRRNKRCAPKVVESKLRTIVEVAPMADNRTMEELLQAPMKGYGEAIVIPEINADHFEIKTNLLQLVQANPYHGFETENPHTYINSFKSITSTLKFRDVPNDVIKLMMFPYSLEGAARVWYDKEPPNSILTWDDLVNKFVNQFFPPSKTTHLKNEISRFTQRFEETFGEAWERFKEMLRLCPHHGFTELTQIDTFYNGLNENDQDSLNVAAGGNLLSKTTREALNIIETKSKVRYSRYKLNVSRMNTNSRENASKMDDRIDKLADKISTLVDIFAKKVVAPAAVKAIEQSYVTCGGNHAHYNCDATNTNQSSVCAATGTYNQVAPQNRASNHMAPPGFAPMQNSQNRMNTTFRENASKTDDRINKLADQISTLVDIFAKKVVTLTTVKATLPKPNILYPSSLNDQKLREKATNQMEKFFQIFQDLHFDISFADALLLMPKFASTIKSLLANKDKLFELAKIPLNENYSTMLLKMLPKKLGDPAKFLYHQGEVAKAKSSIEEPLKLELKDLPSHLKYSYLEGADKLPVIIAKYLKDDEKEALLKVLKSHKRAIAWKITDIKGIDPRFCTHKILTEEDY